MKKNLLFASVFGALMVNAQSGINVATNGSVHVQPGTLVYSKGGLDVASEGKVISDGHIELEGAYNNSKADGTNVQLLYTDAGAGKETAYGQLIIKDGQSTTGKLYMQTPIIQNQLGDWGEMAFPFASGGSILDVINSAAKPTGETLSLYGNNVATSTNYYRNPVYYSGMLSRDIIPTTGNLMNPTTMYSLYLKTVSGYSLAFINETASSTESFAFAGVPYTGSLDVAQPAQVVAKVITGNNSFTANVAFESLNDMRNYYYRNNFDQAYYTYMEDFAVNLNDPTWGHNIYGYGNPYTSNISLTQLFTDSSITTSDVRVVAIIGSEQTQSSQTEAKYYVQTCADNGGAINSSNCTGDLAAGTDILIRPFGTFWTKYRQRPQADVDSKTPLKTLKFSDNIKTFDYAGLFVPGSNLVGNASSSRVASKKVSARSASANTSNALEVLNLAIANNSENIDNVFIAANPWALSEMDEQLDAVKSENAMLRVVNEDVTSVNKNLHINGISMAEYVGKPINLATSTVAGQPYSFKGSVRIASENNLNNGNFFFEDKKAKKIVRIGSDFEYAYTASDNDNNRFAVYYKEAPIDINQEVSEKTESSMNVAKDASGEAYVVFKGMTGKANVMVYNVLGQLIYADPDVSTNVNYSLNKLPENSGVYIVKVIDNEGNVISKKIVK
ncbi:MAG: T9SS sorting signal type C domain-containing protein [Flavobacteriales bacterium]